MLMIPENSGDRDPEWRAPDELSSASLSRRQFIERIFGLGGAAFALFVLLGVTGCGGEEDEGDDEEEDDD